MRRRDHYDRWDERSYRPAGSGEWDMFYANPITDIREDVEMQHAVSFWRGRTEVNAELSEEKDSSKTCICLQLEEEENNENNLYSNHRCVIV